MFFAEDFKIYRTLALLYSIGGVSVCKHNRQVENQRCSRIGRVQKNFKISRKNTIFNEHPVYENYNNTSAPNMKVTACRALA